MAEQDTLPVSWSDASQLLLPVVRRSTEPPHAWAVTRTDPAARLVRHPLLPFVHELLVLDLPESRVFVSHRHLVAWGASPDMARAAAHANLAPHASDGLQQRIEYGLWQLASGDGVEISRLVLDGWLEAFSGQVSGRPVAIAPASRVLLIGGDGRVPELDRLLRLADEVFRTAQQPVSPVPITVDDRGALIPLSLPDDHPAAAGLAGAERLLAAYEYAAQRDQLLEAGEDAVVAQVQLVRERATGRAWTSCRWSPGDRPVLLPRTDRVQVDDDDGPFTVPFSAIEAHASGCLEETGLDPARLRARWPLPATVARLRTEALPDEP